MHARKYKLVTPHGLTSGHTSPFSGMTALEAIKVHANAQASYAGLFGPTPDTFYKVVEV